MPDSFDEMRDDWYSWLDPEFSGVNLSHSQVYLCIDDLLLVAAEPGMRDIDSCDIYQEWLNRIGGYTNLPAYVACLESQARRRTKAMPHNNVKKTWTPERWAAFWAWLDGSGEPLL